MTIREVVRQLPKIFITSYAWGIGLTMVGLFITAITLGFDTTEHLFENYLVGTVLSITAVSFCYHLVKKLMESE